MERFKSKIFCLLKNKKFTDILIFILLLIMIGIIFYTSRKINTIYFYAYTRLLYIPLVISALMYDLKRSLITPTLISIGEFLEIYLTEKSYIFLISIPLYYFVSISISYFKLQAERLRDLIKETNENLKDMKNALISALEAKDVYTQGHSQRVCKLVTQIVYKMGIEGKKAEDIITAAKLHDIGKIGIRDEVLNKPGKLTDQEFAEIMDHPVMSYEIINKMKVMENIAKIIRHHHEKYDGKGYPDGLKGEKIPLGSRIIAVADAFDAMTSKRPYRDSFTMAQAIEELKKNAGTQFDPKIVDAFISIIEDLGIDY
ncbi:HD-GYP domain-containing protein [Thermoanaerobacter sp. A7A]|uniref:HD-GYP domain-containing protein n=1 Tax=Thermoanaerobacter sp. A7A TaxID=1350366 RepID=UPI000411B5B8|nr:HD-GYP domain-containing protein [Thermoanaerobacter sp. A7A]